MAAHSARRRLKLASFLLAMLFLDLDDGKTIDCLFLRLLGSLAPLSFLFAQSAYLFEYVVTCETLVIIIHEIVGVKLAILHLHAEEFSLIEQVHEASQ